MNNLQLVLRHYNSTQKFESEISSNKFKIEPSLTNTYIGTNITLEEDLLLQFNYVLVGGDNDQESDRYFVGGGRTANAFLAMAQVTF